MRAVSKYSESTERKSTPTLSGAAPATSKGVMIEAPLNGTWLVRLTDRTPGTPRTVSAMAS